jgi:hypothetical protein
MGRTRDTSKILTTVENIDVTEQLDSLIVVASASPSIDTKIWVDTTTASAPSIRTYSSNLWRGTRLGNLDRYFVASGGLITNHGGYRIHKFTSTQNFVVSESSSIDQNSFNGEIEYLCIGGGGAGGTSSGGGGGGGGFVSGNTTIISANTYTITVGAGGPVDSNGTNSAFNFGFSVEAVGGGYGGKYAVLGNNGGSGGGGPARPTSGMVGGIGVSGQGFNGGSGWNNNSESFTRGGGGGGAGGNGVTPNSSVQANGGIGKTSLITGTSIYYSGGGGGGTEQYSAGTGGLGGGGNGGRYPDPGTYPAAENGQANTGGGGGGGYSTRGQGGSGIVIIRYLIN